MMGLQQLQRSAYSTELCDSNSKSTLSLLLRKKWSQLTIPKHASGNVFIFPFDFMTSDISKDFEVQNPPTDGISGLEFSPQADFLAASSWDNQIRVYEVLPTGATVPKAAYSHQGPALCVSWNMDGTKIFSGGADKAGRLYDISTGQSSQFAEHSDTIRHVKCLGNQPNIVVTGSWDKTLRYWDMRSPQPIQTVQLPERCYAMDTKENLLVVATADRHVVVYDLNNPTVPFKTTQSPLKWQTRTVTCFPEGKGYAIGSIEGRVGMQYIEDREQSKNFSFKCHRDTNNNVFSVNAINFHPIHGTFSTAGSDGTFSFWDKDSKQRLKPFPSVGNTIPCTAFNRNGTIFAYAASYDWSKGYKNANPNQQHKLMLHATKEDDVKPRTAKKR